MIQYIIRDEEGRFVDRLRTLKEARTLARDSPEFEILLERDWDE